MLKFARIVVWALVGALGFVTLSPIGLRPVLAESANLERALAYALLGFLLALAYPRQKLLAFALGVAVAAGLEIGQAFVASRHGRVPDFLVKATSAGFGVLAAQALLMLRVLLKRSARA